jgi:hypothetical protein
MTCSVYVVTPRNIPFCNQDHPTCYSELKKDLRIRTLEPTDSIEEKIDHIVVLLTQFHFYDNKEYELLKGWLRISGAVHLICHSWPEKLSKRLMREFKSIFKYPELMLRAKSIGYEYYPSTIETPSLWRKYLIGGGPHPRYFHDKTICKSLYSSWKVDTHRPIKFSFLGTEAPERRKEILNEIRYYLTNTAKPDVQIISDYNRINKYDKLLAFIRSTPIGNDIPRPHLEYIQCLSDSDFTLCIPGYTIWSCRPYESLLRGSIPIIDYREATNYLDIGLLDGRNCIFVYEENWQRAIRKALSLQPVGLEGMRISIKEMVSERINLASWSKKLMQKLAIYPGI